MRRRHVHTVAVVGALIGAASLSVPALAAPPRPNLKPATARLDGTPTSVAPGARVAVRVTVANAGRKRSPGSRIELVVSSNAKRDRSDKVLTTAAVPALKPGAKKQLAISGKLPASVTSGEYRLLTCTDSAKRVRESSETDNCRSGGTIRLITLPTDMRPAIPQPSPPVPEPTPTATPEPTATPTPTPPPVLSIGDAIVDEGDDGLTDLVFEVRADRAPSQPASAAVTLQGLTAAVGSDVQPLTGRVVLAPGAQTATVVIRVIGDVVDEPDETVRVVLSAPDGATLGDAEGTGTIRDDDEPEPGPPSARVDGVALAEGNAGEREATFVLRLDRPMVKPGSIRVRTSDGTATAGSDYNAVERTLTLAQGATAVDIPVTVFGDTTLEPDETFRLELDQPENVIVGTASADATIQNDDSEPTAPDAPDAPVLPAPPDPTEVIEGQQEAPVEFADAAAFLTAGDTPIQSGVEPDALADERVAVLRGKVSTAAGGPVVGARVSVHGAPELGQTATRADGRFDLAVNGGEVIVLEIERAGYMPIQRTVTRPDWNAFAPVDDIVLRPYTQEVDAIAPDASQPQVADAREVSDAAGDRTSALLFMPGTEAEAQLPDGSTIDLSSLSVRMTEYTAGEAGTSAMPGDLPATSGFTYAVEMSADEAVRAGATEVRFTKPVVNYVDNFIGFPAGTPVPTGYYDREQGAWVPSRNGLVIAIVGERDGVADVDVTGDGVADAAEVLVVAGIGATERRVLSERYGPGDSLWRIEIQHFTPWDHNWPYGPPEDAEEPCGRFDFICKAARKLREAFCKRQGSIIDCERQTLRERFDVPGTGLTLNYASDRGSGRAEDFEVEVPVTGPTVPASLKEIRVRLEIAGRTIERTVPPQPDGRVTLSWDGRDAYGRRLTQPAKGKLRLSYVYPLVYQEPAQFARSFSRLSGRPLAVDRPGMEIESVDEREVELGAFDPRPYGLGGLTFDAHHTYDPASRTVFLGNGDVRAADTRYTQALEPFAGSGTSGFAGDGGPALPARLASPRGLAVGPDGTTYVADTENDRIRAIAPDGIIRTFAGVGEPGSSGDGGPATAARLASPSAVATTPGGALLIADTQNNRVRLVGPTGTIRTVAGGGQLDDGAAATDARLRGPAGVAPANGGGFYVADANAHRVRLVGADGVISTIAGNGLPGGGGDGGPADAADLNRPTALAVDELGRLLIADTGNGRVRRVGIDGRIETIAGGGAPEDGVGDGGRAVDAALRAPAGLALTDDGDTLIVDRGTGRVRRVYADGTIGTLAGAASATTTGTAYGSRLAGPEGVGVHPDGRVIIGERDGHRLLSIGGKVRGIDEGDVLVPSEDRAVVYQFRPSGRHFRTLDALTGGEIRRFTYDAVGRLATIVGTDGGVTRIERDAEGDPTAIVGPYGATTTLETNAAGAMTSITSPAGRQAKLAYGSDGLLARMEAGGSVHEYEYDGSGRLVLDRGEGVEQRLSRTEALDSESVTLSITGGSTTVYTTSTREDGTSERTVVHDGRRVSHSKALPDGTVETTGADGTTMRVVTTPDQRFGAGVTPITQQFVRTPGGRTSTTERAESMTAPSTVGTNPFAFTTLSRSLAPPGKSVTASFVAASRTLSSATAGGQTMSLKLDDKGRVTNATAGARAGVTVNYDAQGRQTSVAQGGRSASITYGADGAPATVRDALGREKSTTRDADGFVTETTLPGGRTIGFDYDSAGRMTAVKPAGRGEQRYTYDSDGDLVAYSRPPTAAGDGADYATRYEHDSVGRLTAVRRPGRDPMEFGYTGGLLASVKAGGRTLAGYDHDPGSGVLTAVDGRDARIAFAYDGPLLLSETWSGSVAATVARRYDTALRPLDVTVNGAQIADFAYDSDGQLRRAGALTVNRDVATGAPIGTTAGSLASTLGRNTLGEIDRLRTARGQTVVFDEEIVRDALSRVTKATEHSDGTTTVWEYRYKPGGELSQVLRDGAVVAEFEYDGQGNRTRVDQAGAPAVTAEHDGQDRLTRHGTTTLEYARSGELIRRTGPAGVTTYDYDELGGLRSVALASGTSVEYALDGLGRRIGRRAGSGPWTRWIHTTEGRGPSVELSASGDVVSRFIYGSRNEVPDLMVRGGTTYQLVTDQIGSVRRVVDIQSGAVAQALDYDAFGRVTRDTQPGFQPFGFAGGHYDSATGLVRFGVRDYDAELGRWTAADPAGAGAGDTNLYAYVDNDPVNLRDPTGRVIPAVAAIAVGAGIGCGVAAIGSLLCDGSLKKAGKACVVGATATVAGALAAAGAIALLPAGASMAVVATTGAVTGSLAENASSYLMTGGNLASPGFAKDVVIGAAVPIAVGRTSGIKKADKGFQTGRPKQGPGRPITRDWIDQRGPKVKDYLADNAYEDAMVTGLNEIIKTETDAFSEDGEPDFVSGGTGGW